MPGFSRPKGVRTQTSREWFYAAAAAGSGAAAQVGAHDSQIILLNTDQARWLFVYSISIISNFSSQCFYFTQQGLTAGAVFLGPTFPVVCDGGRPSADIYSASVAPLGSGKTFPFSPALSGGSPVPNDVPLAIVKPGYCFIAESTADQLTTFGFLVVGP